MYISERGEAKNDISDRRDKDIKYDIEEDEYVRKDDKEYDWYVREGVYVKIVYISERGGLRSDAPRHRGDDGGTPAHSNQYSICSYDKNNCASIIVARSVIVAFCSNVYNIKNYGNNY